MADAETQMKLTQWGLGEYLEYFKAEENSTMLLLTIAFFLFAYLIYWKVKRRRLEYLASKIPGPPALPIVGNSLAFVGVGNASQLWDRLAEIYDYEEGVTRFWFGPELSLSVVDPFIVNAILKHKASLNKTRWYKFFSFSEDGILSTDTGKIWMKYRSALNEILHGKNISVWHDQVVLQFPQLIETLDDQVWTGQMDVCGVLKLFNLDVTSGLLFGVELNELKETRFNYFHLMEKATSLGFKRVLRPNFLAFIFKLTKEGRYVDTLNDELNAISRHIITERIRQLNEKGIDLKCDFEAANYADVIIQTGSAEGLSVKDMGMQLIDVIFAATDTTAVIESFALLYLAMNQKFQEEAYQEQVKLFGDSQRPPTAKELQQMPYLTMVMDETQRLQGVAMISRVLDEETQFGKFIIPSGTQMLLHLNRMHRHPKYWERPEEFYPNHFQPENVAKRPKCAFIPLSSGPRSCPGGLLRNVLFKMTLSQLIRRYVFTTSRKFEDLKFQFAFMLEPTNGYPLEAVRR